VDKTISWAASCVRQPLAEGQLLFGIVQGGEYADLREKCALELAGMPFAGYAIGGVSVGEPERLLIKGIQDGIVHLPADKPRYLMGVGKLWQILEAVGMGVDMFDCVMPTRCGRNGTAFTMAGQYAVKAGAYKNDTRPVEEGCGCYACRNFSRAYIRHLINVDEMLGVRLLTLHNVYRYTAFMAELRGWIKQGLFPEMLKESRERRKKAETDNVTEELK
jgi:queuine tRNA-ribosyltransferase